jgi:hypothetical protein
MRNKTAIRILHIFTLWGLAVAQPLYDILGKHAEFFVARSSGPTDILSFIALVSFVAPATASLLYYLVRKASKITGTILFVLIAFLTSSATILPLVKKFSPQVYAAFLITLLIGAVFVYLYFNFKPVAKFLTLYSPSILVFPLVFVFISPVSKIILPSEDLSENNKQFEKLFDKQKKYPNIVVIIFDEIATQHLMDENKNIDAARYPNFSTLSKNSYWLRNTFTVSDSTVMAVPAIMTGKRHIEGSKHLPILADYPNNIFTLLGNHYDIHTYEATTSLSPTEKEGNWRKTLESTVNDAMVVYSHILAPEEMADRLGRVTQSWDNFELRKNGNATQKSLVDKKIAAHLREDRSKIFEQFVDEIKVADKPILNLIDICIPHPPLIYYPSGKNYGNHILKGMGSSGVWANDQAALTLALGRHLAQLGYVDNLLGKAMERLHELGIYDDSLIVVMADHGVNYNITENPRRILNEDNFISIVPIPLFIKVPYQKEGVMSDTIVDATDVMPTIAEVLGFELPWPHDGYSILQTDRPERASIQTYGESKREHLEFSVSQLIEARDKDLERQLELFGSGNSRPAGLYATGPYRYLFGTRVSDHVTAENSQHSMILNDYLLPEYVSREDKFIPGYVDGELLPNGDNAVLPLAVALNGTIVATGTTFRNSEFGFLVPDDSFSEGSNKIEIYVIQAHDTGTIELLPVSSNIGSQIAAVGANDYQLLATRVLTGDGQKIKIKGYAGYLDSVSHKDGVVILTGWTARGDGKNLADLVSIFIDGKHIYSGKTDIPRTGVVNIFNNENLLNSGFSFKLPKSVFPGTRNLRIIGFSDGEAYEVIIGDDKKEIIFALQ